MYFVLFKFIGGSEGRALLKPIYLKNVNIIIIWHNLTLCNCEWKAHIFFVHRSMHWKAVHLWTQVHQTETFFIILFFFLQASVEETASCCCLAPLLWLFLLQVYFFMYSFHLHPFKIEVTVQIIMSFLSSRFPLQWLSIQMVLTWFNNLFELFQCNGSAAKLFLKCHP